MEKYYEVIVRILELLETMDSGLEQVKLKTEEGKFEETLMMFNDLVVGYSSIESAMQPMLEKLPENNLENKSQKMRDSVDQMVATYENKEPAKGLELMKSSLLPAFQEWKKEIEKTIKPYILS
ncbi:hypothetical protein SYNTR_1808 [Candidatus Syntrophocurvum alkaliphilum]|uniref:DUF8042 domain-containing protein n=1 Tax=Candidatus Syntrophocurvum alkaliphilum TaxID=2293317 RepID=A0A6I6DCT8_9FIRM|nr:hypothetical protein [Candidatus Syntrophocurvum alkaliphilum]QGU00402.1 hypothetical protein SYNTR_1808 [Candidatus Syntrophocurvum alkaliphilum]